MRVSVIPVDKVIVIDGNGVIVDEWKFDDSHIHAIQWFHDKGHIELKTNDPNIELDDISMIQPYIDKYMEMISSIEEQVLLEQERERLRIESEEKEKILAEEKKRKEQEQVQNLIDQNKEIRKAKARLELEQSLMLEELHNKQKHYDIELERKELERQAELESLKSQELNKLIKEKDSELVQKYENLLDELEKQRNVMQDEQKSFIEATKRKEELIEFEKKSLEEQREHFQNEMMQKRKLLEKEREQLDQMQNDMVMNNNYNKMMLESIKQSAELEAEHVDKLRKIHQKELEHAKMMQELAEKEYQDKKKLLEYTIKETEFKKQELEREYHRSVEVIDEERKAIESFKDSIGKDIEIAKYNINDQFRETSLTELISNHNNQEVNVDELSKILNDLDPEKVYTTLTSGEIDENNFPVEKAIVWFSALKKVIDEKSQG